MALSRLVRKLLLLGTCAVMICRADQGHHHQHQTQGELPKNFNDPSITQDEEHLREHLKDSINLNKNKMSIEEMEFYYFKLHDTNNDTHLDGTEILQAMSHMIPVPELQLHEKLGKSKEQIDALLDERNKGMIKYYEGNWAVWPETLTSNHLVLLHMGLNIGLTDMIDQVLNFDDIDKNGYLTYPEFVRARRRDEYNQKRMASDQMKMQQMQFEQFQQWQQANAANQEAGQQGQFRPTIPQPPQKQ